MAAALFRLAKIKSAKVAFYNAHATAETAPTSIMCTDYACALDQYRCVRTCVSLSFSAAAVTSTVRILK